MVLTLIVKCLLLYVELKMRWFQGKYSSIKM